MNFRRIISLILVFSFVLLLVTGIVLYIVPAGRIAYWADWKLIGLTKEQWGNIHIISGILGLLAGLIHIIYNWQLILLYLKNRNKELRFFNLNFNIALIITLTVLVGTYYNLPPLSYIFEYSEEIKDSATKKYGEPPYSHAELSTIKKFCEMMQIDLELAVKNLKSERIRFNDENDILKDVADANDLSPQGVYLIIRKGTEAQKINLPDLPPMGTGKKTIAILCEQYHLDTPALLNYLGGQQIKATADQTLKQIAEQEEMEVIELYQIIKDFSSQDR